MTFLDAALWFFWLASTIGCFALGFMLGEVMRGKRRK